MIIILDPVLSVLRTSWFIQQSRSSSKYTVSRSINRPYKLYYQQLACLKSKLLLVLCVDLWRLVVTCINRKILSITISFEQKKRIRANTTFILTSKHVHIYMVYGSNTPVAPEIILRSIQLRKTVISNTVGKPYSVQHVLHLHVECAHWNDWRNKFLQLAGHELPPGSCPRRYA